MNIEIPEINDLISKVTGLEQRLLNLEDKVDPKQTWFTLKQACLRHCRTPMQFVTHHWRNGSVGALRMGIEHGVFCLGCCWTLMALLFVGGVMNLFWIVGLTVFVLLEKTIPAGHWLGSLGGISLIVWGVWMLAIAL